MQQEQRQEFWRRFRLEIDAFLVGGTSCEIRSNTFDVRQWDVQINVRESRPITRSVTLNLLEHAPSTAVFLIAVSRTFTVDGTETELERLFIPVFHDSRTDRFSLHADHGPVDQSQMPEFFCGMAHGLIRRL